MTRININSSQKRSLPLNTACVMLEFSNVLECMKRHHSIIMVSSSYEHRWVDLGFHVMDRGELHLIIKSTLFTISIVPTPLVPASEFVESEHITHRYLSNCSGEQLRSLIGTSSHQKPTIRPTVHMKFVGRSNSFRN